MYALLILYLIGVVVWFVYGKYAIGESYEASIVLAVFYPILISILYIAMTAFIIITPICEIITHFKKPKKEITNDN